MKNNLELGSLVAIAAAVSMGTGLSSLPNVAWPVGPRRPRPKPVRNTPEIEAWNEAVEKRKAEKRLAKQQRRGG